MEYLHKVLNYLPQIAIFVSLIAVLYSAHKSAESKFNVFDYFIDPVTGKASITKTLQVTAGLTATWVIVKFAMTNNLQVDMFATYMAAMGISEAWSKFVGAKYSTLPAQ